jgi:pimeloyl-ACP methyl ester carboxylesterase
MPSFKTSDDVRLHYEDTGTEASGPPILCLAGLTRNSTDFEYVLPYLAEAHRVIRLDSRGRGRSARSPDWRDYSVPVEARDVLELLAHLGLGQVAILGTSRGGLIAMALAAAAKDRLAGVCLNDIGPVIERAGLDAIRAYVGQPPEAATREEAVAMRAGLMAGFEGVPESRWREEVDHHYVDAEEGLAINYDPRLRDAVLETLGEEGEAAKGPDLWPLFDLLEGLPLALIRGANSDLLSAETAAEMRRRRPDMIYAEVPGRGHVPFLDEREALEALNEWTMLL